MVRAHQTVQACSHPGKKQGSQTLPRSVRCGQLRGRKAAPPGGHRRRLMLTAVQPGSERTGNIHAGTFAKATAIGGLPVPVTAIVLPRPANPCFPDLETGEKFQSAAPDLFLLRAHARCARSNTFWMAEHHFQPEGTELIPDLLMMAMHLCGVTKNIKIGCGFDIVPMWHPLRLAEDYAMADILTGGRSSSASGAPSPMRSRPSARR